MAVAVACQTAQRPDEPPGTAAGSTTLTRIDTTPASGGVTLTLDRASYAPGAPVTMRITSQTRDTLGFNQCSSRTIERQEGNGWVPVREPQRMCTMELRLLMPNETQTATTDLPATLSAGTYRMVLRLGRQSTQGGEVRAVSTPFRVT